MGDRTLPFQRGTTWKDGNTASTSTPNVTVAGQSYDSSETDREVGTGLATGHATRLIALRAIGVPATITQDYIGWPMSTASTIAVGTGYRANTHTGPSGGRFYLLDDAMATGAQVAQGDIAYFVEKGPARARVSVTYSAILRGDQLVFMTRGALRKARTLIDADEFVYAVAMDAATTTGVRKQVLVGQGKP